MGGCSVVVFMPLFGLLYLVLIIGNVLLQSAGELVSSPALPCMIISLVCSLAAIADIVRILWRRYREGEAFGLSWRMFARPAVLFAVALILFIIAAVIAGTTIWGLLTQPA